MTATLTINKSAYVLPTNVSFKDTIITYDGKEHSLTVSNLPEGIIAKYTNNVGTNIGKYEATVVFELSNELKANYTEVAPKSMKATMEIVDNEKPVITLKDEYKKLINKNGEICFVKGNAELDIVNVTDNYDKNLKATYEGNFDGIKTGVYPLTYSATDTAGNTGTLNLVIRITDYAPNIYYPITNDVNGKTEAIMDGQTITKYFVAVIERGEAYYKKGNGEFALYEGQELTEGTYTFYIEADGKTYDEVQFTIDTFGPVVTNVANKGTYKVGHKIVFEDINDIGTVTLLKGGVAVPGVMESEEFKTQGTYTLNEVGTYVFNATDKHGNEMGQIKFKITL